MHLDVCSRRFCPNAKCAWMDEGDGMLHHLPSVFSGSCVGSSFPCGCRPKTPSHGCGDISCHKKNAVSLARSKDLVLTQFLEPPSAAHEGPFFSFFFLGVFFLSAVAVRDLGRRLHFYPALASNPLFIRCCCGCCLRMDFQSLLWSTT